MTKPPKHPMQPIYLDKSGVVRFKENAIVSHLLATGPNTLNTIAQKEFSQEDREQFAQLIGYSVGGYADLGYVSDKSCKKAKRKADKILSEVK